MTEIVPSVKIVEKGDIMGIVKIVNDNKTNLNSCLLKQKGDQKMGSGGDEMQWVLVLKSRERKCAFSLVFGHSDRLFSTE